MESDNCACADKLFDIFTPEQSVSDQSEAKMAEEEDSQAGAATDSPELRDKEFLPSDLSAPNFPSLSDGVLQSLNSSASRNLMLDPEMPETDEEGDFEVGALIRGLVPKAAWSELSSVNGDESTFTGLSDMNLEALDGETEVTAVPSV